MWRIFYPLMLPTIIGVWVWSMLHAIRIAGAPLLLYEGKENQVLAILIWNMWDEGNIEAVGAIGTLMIIFLLLVTLSLRMIGFGRGAPIQQSSH
jgi:iron(III) transport system permease protein